MADVVPNSPTKADLPKAPEPLQQELVGFNAKVKLRHSECEEKNPLPTKDDITQDKQEEKHKQMLSDVEEFKRASLKNQETQEKVYMPSKEDISKEKIIQQVPTFANAKLKHAETVEKHGPDGYGKRP